MDISDERESAANVPPNVSDNLPAEAGEAGSSESV
jgi:hypothetical protein